MCPGATLQIATLQALPATLFAWWMQEMRVRWAIHLFNLEDLAPLTCPE